MPYFLAAGLNGSARASNSLAAEATRLLGGRLDVLVNSAGIHPGQTTPATDEAAFDHINAVDVNPVFPDRSHPAPRARVTAPHRGEVEENWLRARDEVPLEPIAPLP